jgi:hypothetical protein
MRRAKQRRSEDIASHAQRMVTERATRDAHDYNDLTHNSTMRAIEADRELSKSVALGSGIVDRRNHSTQSPKVRTRFEPQNYNAPKPDHPIDRNLVSKRKEQNRPNHGGHSIPPGQKRTMNRDTYKKLNDRQPRLHPKASMQPPHSAHGIGSNPTVDRRRQQKLETLIREAAMSK